MIPLSDRRGRATYCRSAAKKGSLRSADNSDIESAEERKRGTGRMIPGGGRGKRRITRRLRREWGESRWFRGCVNVSERRSPCRGCLLCPRNVGPGGTPGRKKWGHVDGPHSPGPTARLPHPHSDTRWALLGTRRHGISPSSTWSYIYEHEPALLFFSAILVHRGDPYRQSCRDWQRGYRTLSNAFACFRERLLVWEICMHLEGLGDSGMIEERRSVASRLLFQLFLRFWQAKSTDLVSFCYACV